MTTSYSASRYLGTTGALADAGSLVAEARIRAVVDEFYQRARRDERLGPVFEEHVADWDAHLERMTDFWSSVLRRTGRYSGNPMARHQEVGGLDSGHFDRWIELFKATVEELCPPDEADAFLFRALRMRQAMSKVLGLTASA